MPDTPQPDSTKALAAFGVLAGPHAGEEIPVRSPVATIGQGTHNDVVLDDDSISKTHARLEYERGSWRLTDLGSTNGTSVEGVRLAPEVPTPLTYGSTVRFGGLQLQFRAVERADPEAARAAYVAPAAPTPVAQRSSGMRFPVWLFIVVILLIGAAVAFFLIEPPAAPEPAPAETEAVALLEAPGAPPALP